MKKLYLLFSVLTLLILNVTAQVKDGAVTLPESISYSQIKIAEYKITGNKLTKDWYIIRELDFKIGDTLSTRQKGDNFDLTQKRFVPGDSSELHLRMIYSRENIINTNLFLTADLSLEQLAGDQYRLLIDVVERHYWWLFPVVKLNAPNFNEWLRDPDIKDVSMGLFFSHNNLFGISHQSSLVGYVGKSYAAAFGYRIPWIGKGKKTGVTFGLGYENMYTVEYASVENERQMLYESNSQQIAKFSVNFNMRPSLYNYASVKLTGSWISISDSLYQPRFKLPRKRG
jgi:hypothetical protein